MPCGITSNSLGKNTPAIRFEATVWCFWTQTNVLSVLCLCVCLYMHSPTYDICSIFFHRSIPLISFTQVNFHTSHARSQHTRRYKRHKRSSSLVTFSHVDRERTRDNTTCSRAVPRPDDLGGLVSCQGRAGHLHDNNTSAWRTKRRRTVVSGRPGETENADRKCRSTIIRRSVGGDGGLNTSRNATRGGGGGAKTFPPPYSNAV